MSLPGVGRVDDELINHVKRIEALRKQARDQRKAEEQEHAAEVEARKAKWRMLTNRYRERALSGWNAGMHFCLFAQCWHPQTAD